MYNSSIMKRSGDVDNISTGDPFQDYTLDIETGIKRRWLSIGGLSG